MFLGESMSVLQIGGALFCRDQRIAFGIIKKKMTLTGMGCKFFMQPF